MPAGKKQEAEMERRGFITIREAANRMHCTVGVIYRAIRDGELKTERVGRRTYIELDSFRGHAGVITEPAP